MAGHPVDQRVDPETTTRSTATVGLGRRRAGNAAMRTRRRILARRGDTGFLGARFRRAAVDRRLKPLKRLGRRLAGGTTRRLGCDEIGRVVVVTDCGGRMRARLRLGMNRRMAGLLRRAAGAGGAIDRHLLLFRADVAEQVVLVARDIVAIERPLFLGLRLILLRGLGGLRGGRVVVALRGGFILPGVGRDPGFRDRVGHPATRHRNFGLPRLRVDAGGNHGHAQRPAHLGFQRGADDDVGVRVDLFADPVRGLVQLEQGDVGAAGDVDQHTLRTVQADFVQQRVGDGLLGRLDCTVLARRLARAHHGLAHLVHHRANIGEVEVDEAWLDHQVGHALDALIEHVVGHREGFGECGLFVRQPEQVLVGNDDESIHNLLKGLDTLFRLAHPLCALELEGFRDDANGQHAKLARGLRDDRGSTRSGAAAHPRGDEAHMRAGKVVDDLFQRFLGSGGTDSGARACAKTLGHLHADLDAVGRLRLLQRLRVGVRHDELDPLQLLVDHVVDGIAARAPHAEYGDPGREFFLFGHDEVECHALSACLCPGLRRSAACSPESTDHASRGHQKNARPSDIWAKNHRLLPDFGRITRSGGYQFSRNHFMARRKDRDG